jgi:hypothetical protein
MSRPARPGRRAVGGQEAHGDAISCALEPRTAILGARAVSDFTQTERAFQASVLAYARMMGWQAFHDNATNAPRRCSACGVTRSLPRNVAGMPDLILIRRPRIVWAELKSERGKLTDDQRAWIEELRACGQAVYVWRPSDWREVERVLR